MVYNHPYSSSNSFIILLTSCLNRCLFFLGYGNEGYQHFQPMGAAVGHVRAGVGEGLVVDGVIGATVCVNLQHPLAIVALEEVAMSLGRKRDVAVVVLRIHLVTLPECLPRHGLDVAVVGGEVDCEPFGQQGGDVLGHLGLFHPEGGVGVEIPCVVL